MTRSIQFLALYCMWVVVETDEANSRERWTKGGWFSESDAENAISGDHEWEDWTSTKEAP